MNIDLGSGERIMLRRALQMYMRHFEDQLREHTGNEYESSLDRSRIEAAGHLSEKLLFPNGISAWIEHIY